MIKNMYPKLIALLTSNVRIALYTTTKNGLLIPLNPHNSISTHHRCVSAQPRRTKYCDFWMRLDRNSRNRPSARECKSQNALDNNDAIRALNDSPEHTHRVVWPTKIAYRLLFKCVANLIHVFIAIYLFSEDTKQLFYVLFIL